MEMTLKEFKDLLLEAQKLLKKTSWHWLSYHFSVGPRPFAISILDSCAIIDRASKGMGAALLADLLSIGGRERDEGHYEQLIQKLSEILVIERLVASQWPNGTTFEHEPSANAGGPRPELMITFPGGRLVVEVKTPSLLQHVGRRNTNGTQLPYRGGLPLDLAPRQVAGDGVTLPRDNPVRDFLADAERKFRGSRRVIQGPGYWPPSSRAGIRLARALLRVQDELKPATPKAAGVRENLISPGKMIEMDRSSEQIYQELFRDRR